MSFFHFGDVDDGTLMMKNLMVMRLGDKKYPDDELVNQIKIHCHG